MGGTQQKLVWIVADVGVSVGLGHLMRELAFAEELCRTVRVKFILLVQLASEAAEVGPIVSQVPYQVEFLTVDSFVEEVHQSWNGERPDGIVVDSYMVTAEIFSILRKLSSVLMVTDDRREVFSEADILLNQNLVGISPQEGRALYADIVPNHCRLLLGPSYALLRSQFRADRAGSRTPVNVEFPISVLVAFGGADPTFETEKVLLAYSKLASPSAQLLVIPGGGEARRQDIARTFGSLRGVEFLSRVDNMADLLRRVDVVFGAAGSSVWERAAIGMPSYVIQSADNQRDIVDGVQRLGMAFFVGQGSETTEFHWQTVLEERLDGDRDQWQRMSVVGMEEVDGLGVSRVVKELKSLLDRDDDGANPRLKGST